MFLEGVLFMRNRIINRVFLPIVIPLVSNALLHLTGPGTGNRYVGISREKNACAGINSPAQDYGVLVAIVIASAVILTCS